MAQVQLEAVITARDEASKKLKQFSKNMGNIGDQMKSVGRTMTTRFTLPVVAGFGYAVKAASDNEEALNKFQVVFGEYANETEKWIDTNREAMLSSRTEIIKNLSAFQDLLVPLGINRRRAAELSKTYVGLAEDVSSFNNVPVVEVQEAIQSAMTGMYRPMKRYGVVLDEARIQAKAFSMGLIEEGEELDLVNKQLVIQEMILEGTKDAHGDVERSAASFANQMRFLKRDLNDLANDIGEILLPVATDLVGKIRVLTDRFKNLTPETQKTIVVVSGLVATIGPLIWILGTLLKSLKTVISVFKALTWAFNPLVLAIGLFTAGIIGARYASKRFAPIIGALAGPIGSVIVMFRFFNNVISQAIGLLNSARSAAERLRPSLWTLAGPLGGIGAMITGRGYQSGGIVEQTGPAIVHEGEKVIPKGAHAGPSGDGVTINVYGNVNAGSEDQIADFGRKVARQFKLSQMGAQ